MCWFFVYTNTSVTAAVASFIAEVQQATEQQFFVAPQERLNSYPFPLVYYSFLRY
jgi:hypothetical protein